MKSFIVNAIMGAAAVQAVTVQSMTQLTSESERRFSSQIDAGDPLYVHCPYVRYEEKDSSGIHDSAHVDIDGLQVATTDDKMDDPVDFLFFFENLGKANNVM